MTTTRVRSLPLNGVHTDVVLPDKTTMGIWVRHGFRMYAPNCYDCWHATPAAPNSYAELMEWAANNRLGVNSLPVFSGACDRSIYTAADNQVFRAWHDVLHIKEGLSFSTVDELAAAELHCGILNWVRAPYEVVKAVEADTRGQALYYDKHKAYVDDQHAFVTECLRHGVDATVYSGRKF